MATTIQEFLERRAAYYDEDLIDISKLADWQRDDIDRTLSMEAPSGNLKHITRSLSPGNRNVACGPNLSIGRAKDIICPWTFEMLHYEGRTDLCLSCMRKQRRAWANTRPYCIEQQAA